MMKSRFCYDGLTFLVSGLLSIATASAWADEASIQRFLYPLAPSKAGDSPTFVIDVTEIADEPASVRWAEESKTLCEHWFPIVYRFLATEDWTVPKEIKLIFKKELKVPAYASGSTITISTPWITQNPDDFGCVIHELTHVIQAYPNSRGKPGDRKSVV